MKDYDFRTHLRGPDGSLCHIGFSIYRRQKFTKEIKKVDCVKCVMRWEQDQGKKLEIHQ